MKIVPVEGHTGVCRMIFLLHLLMRWSKAFSFCVEKGASLLYLLSWLFEKKDYRTRLSSFQRGNPSRSSKSCFNEQLFLQEACDVFYRWSVKTYCLLDADGHQRSYFHLLEKKVLLNSQNSFMKWSLKTQTLSWRRTTRVSSATVRRVRRREKRTSRHLERRLSVEIALCVSIVDEKGTINQLMLEVLWVVIVNS